MPFKAVRSTQEPQEKDDGDGCILLQKGRISERDVGWPAGTQLTCTGRFERSTLQGTGNYSSGRRNSSPKMRMSPKTSWRRTLAMIGGVSAGTRLEDEAEGAGMVR